MTSADQPTELELARDAWEDSRPELYAGIYLLRDEYVAVVEAEANWAVVGEDGELLQLVPAALRSLLHRRADCHDREHGLAARLVSIVNDNRDQRLTAYALEQLHGIFTDAMLRCA